MRLIDIDSDFIASLFPDHHQDYQTFNLDDAYDKGWEDALDNLEDAPTIDAVPVVRCRECRKWDADPDSYGKDDGPKGKCMKSFEETYDNDFCSYGQRKIETVLPKSDAKDKSLEAGHD